jgi:hypothetical protein
MKKEIRLTAYKPDEFLSMEEIDEAKITISLINIYEE